MKSTQTKSNETKQVSQFSENCATEQPAKPYTTKEVCAKLGLAYRSLKSAVDAGDVPTLFRNRPGRKWPKVALFPRQAIDRIAAEGFRTEDAR